MDRSFSPGSGDLKLLIKEMLTYDMSKGWKLNGCIKSFLFKEAIVPIEIAECPSMQRFWS
jgi:hypothetical protein